MHGVKLRIEIRERQGVAILDVSGDIPQDNTLRDRVRELVAANKNKILLNLANVTSIGDFGLAAFVNAVVWTRKQGGGVKVVKPSKRVQEALVATNLNSIFDIYDDENEALASFT